MLQITDIPTLQKQVTLWKVQQQQVVFVPTMGNLHDGHLQLVEKAKTLGDKVVASIFVNPMQFPPGTDYESYPRTLEDDATKLQAHNVDALFSPGVNEIYPQDLEQVTKVIVPVLSEILCGEHRPGHFAGVTTIVAKLFNIVQPDVAVFGDKDFQQLTIIKKMVKDLCVPVTIESSPTVREKDGLAMSSRNQYLNESERAIAPCLYQTLVSVKEQLNLGAKDFCQLETNAMQALRQAGFKPDYVSIRDSENLEAVNTASQPLVILAAAWLGKARLIDNLIV